MNYLDFFTDSVREPSTEIHTMNHEIKSAAVRYGALFDIPTDLILGIIDVESAGNTFAMRMEPPYRFLVDVRTNKPFRKLTADEGRQDQAPTDFPFVNGAGSRSTEWIGQQCSWGLMQVMGAVARENGFDGYFPELCSTDRGIYYGCKHLASFKKRFFAKYGWAGVVAAYNAGSVRISSTGDFVNQEYVDKVRSACPGVL